MQISQNTDTPAKLDFEVKFTDGEVREILFAAALSAITNVYPVRGKVDLYHPFLSRVHDTQHANKLTAVDTEGSALIRGSLYVGQQ